MVSQLIDPLALRLWKLAEAAPAALRQVHVVRVREAPRFGVPGWKTTHVHRHAVPTAIICLAGVMRLTTARGNMDLRPGSLAVIAPAAWHAEEPLKAGAAIYTQGLLFGKSDIVFITENRRINAMISAQPSERLLHAILATDDVKRRRDLGVDLLSQVTIAAEDVQVPVEVWKMGCRLWHGLDQPLRADQILAAAGVSQRHARRIFSTWFGTGPKQVIRSQQLAIAKALLREGISVDTVISEVGFPDRRSFNRAWRLAFGKSPVSREA